MNRFELFNAMLTRTPVSLVCHIGSVSGLILSIQMEDGSGYCFNVTLSTARGQVTIFVRSPRIH
jgi:hypothetical protein